jgi:hypothetical protein
MERTGFIYIWYDRKRKMYYIGCHLGSENDGYVCSSNRMREAYRRRPEDFKRRILKGNIKRQHLLDEELKWLQMIKDEELRSKYYNIRKTKWDNFINKPICLKGRKLSEETKQKIRIARAKQVITTEHKRKLREWHANNPNHNKSTVRAEKISKSHTGKKLTKEHVEKMKIGKTGMRIGKMFEWIIEGPDGKIYIENGINCFAKENNICANNLRKRGKASGFTIKEKRVLE